MSEAPRSCSSRIWGFHTIMFKDGKQYEDFWQKKTKSVVPKVVKSKALKFKAFLITNKFG